MDHDNLGTVLENPVIRTEDLPTDFDADDAKFREAAALADSGQDIPAELVGVTGEEKASETTATTATERPRDALGRFTKTETGEDIPEADRKPVDEKAPDATATPALSEFEQKKQEKAAKEEERKARSWENLNREKEELAQRRREFDERQRQISQPQQQRQEQQLREYSSQQLLQAHEDFKRTAREAFKRYQETGNEADLDAFNQNDQWAEQAFQNAGQFYQLEQQEAQHAQLEKWNQTWNSKLSEAFKKEPDLAKPDSQLSQRVQNILKQYGQVLYGIEDGFQVGVNIAKLELDAAEAPTLREKLKALEAAKAEQDKLLSPTPGGVTNTAPVKKTLDTMSETELDSYFRRAAMEVDAQHSS